MERNFLGFGVAGSSAGRIAGPEFRKRSSDAHFGEESK